MNSMPNSQLNSNYRNKHNTISVSNINNGVDPYKIDAVELKEKNSRPNSTRPDSQLSAINTNNIDFNEQDRKITEWEEVLEKLIEIGKEVFDFKFTENLDIETLKERYEEITKENEPDFELDLNDLEAETNEIKNNDINTVVNTSINDYKLKLLNVIGDVLNIKYNDYLSSFYLKSLQEAFQRFDRNEKTIEENFVSYFNDAKVERDETDFKNQNAMNLIDEIVVARDINNYNEVDEVANYFIYNQTYEMDNEDKRLHLNTHLSNISDDAQKEADFLKDISTQRIEGCQQYKKLLLKEKEELGDILAIKREKLKALERDILEYLSPEKSTELEQEECLSPQESTELEQETLTDLPPINSIFNLDSSIQQLQTERLSLIKKEIEIYKNSLKEIEEAYKTIETTLANDNIFTEKQQYNILVAAQKATEEALLEYSRLNPEKKINFTYYTPNLPTPISALKNPRYATMQKIIECAKSNPNVTLELNFAKVPEGDALEALKELEGYNNIIINCNSEIATGENANKIGAYYSIEEDITIAFTNTNQVGSEALKPNLSQFNIKARFLQGDLAVNAHKNLNEVLNTTKYQKSLLLEFDKMAGKSKPEAQEFYNKLIENAKQKDKEVACPHNNAYQIYAQRALEESVKNLIYHNLELHELNDDNDSRMSEEAYLGEYCEYLKATLTGLQDLFGNSTRIEALFKGLSPYEANKKSLEILKNIQEEIKMGRIS